MKWKTKEGQEVVAGYVGSVQRKTETLVAVSVANRKSKEETEWVSVAFCSPRSGGGQDLAEFAEKYINVGGFVTVVTNAKEANGYTNRYAIVCELGPRSRRQQQESQPQEEDEFNEEEFDEFGEFDLENPPF